MASPRADTYTAPSGGTVAGGRHIDPTPFEAVANGVWSWFSDPRAVYRNGATYIGWVNSSGDIGVSKVVHSTRSTTSFTLSAAFEADDHDNASLHFLPDGRLACFYCKHNETLGLRMRVSMSPDDISAFSTEVVLPTSSQMTYSNPHYLSATGKTYVHYRQGVGGSGTNPMNVISTADWSSWDAERTWIANTGTRPYIKSINNGVDRIDFLLTDMHPNQGQSDIYHCYMKLDAGVEKFYKSDGTLIGTGPITPSQCTLIYDGATQNSWVWSITYGADGLPRVLFSKFVSTTDHRYMFSRWNGSAWTSPVEITPAGPYLYSGELYYSGGMCFDSQYPDRVYLSRQISGQWEMQEWRTADSGATWSKFRDITSGSSGKNCRPYSPKNHAQGVGVVWWAGTYTTYVNYSTKIMAGPSA